MASDGDAESSTQSAAAKVKTEQEAISGCNEDKSAGGVEQRVEVEVLSGGGGEERGAKGEREGEDSGVIITCPTCRAAVRLPVGGVASLQTNFYMAEGTGGPSGPALLCEMCEEGEAKEASHVCRKCRQRMCRTCKRLHDKITNPREHPVHPVNAPDPVLPPEEEVPPAVKCPTHPQQDLGLFCKTCDVPVCLYCKLTSHESHDAEDLTSAVSRGKERARGVVTTAREQITVLQKSIRRLSRDQKELARQRQEVTEEVSARCDEVLRWVNRSRGELLESIEAKAEVAASGLEGEANRAKDFLETLERLTTRFSNLPNSSTEIWALENELQTALLKDEVFNRFNQLGDSDEQKTFLPLSSDPSLLDLGVMRAYLGELNDTGRTSSSVSLTEQVQQVRNHTADVERRLQASEQNLHQLLQALQAKEDATEVLAKEAKQKAEAAEARLDTLQKQVAFNVWHKTNPLNTPGKGVLILDHAVTNVGNGYDTTTGIFTVPVSGLYNIQGTIMSFVGQSKKVYAGLYVDDTAIYGMLVADSTHSYWDQSTVRAVFHLQQGQRVCLKNLLDTPAAYYSATGQPYTSFSGYLVQAD